MASRRIQGPRGYLDRPEDLALYEYDGSIDKARPDLVVFPQSNEQVAALVKLANESGIPIVGRGAGTGLSSREPSPTPAGMIVVFCAG